MSELTAIFFLIFFGFTSGDTGTSVTHPKIWTVVKLGRAARIKCEVDSSVPLDTNPLHWYRWREGEAFTRLLHFPAGSSTFQKDDGVAGSVTASKSKQTSTLTISTTTASNDNDVYYCAVWSGNRKVFGSGTQLYVTEGAIRAPKVSVYSTSKAVEQKITFLCHASDMFPDIIRFTWQEKNNGQWVDVKKDGLDLLEGRFSKDKTMTSMMLIDQQKAKNNQYACTYTHEANKNAQQSERVEVERKASEDQGSGTQKTPITQTCPPAKITNETANIDALTELFGAARSLYLATWVYTMMIFKSMVYFCAISYFLCTRKMGGKPSGNRRAP
ncbi:immunoglobulin kappa light chain-like [Alosa pseudoharengus]|uniref:immunoglobulin kappa light chain-like n=1 Tax=Alosa pseudoharengus TaxID=34774 RepID=UPI003F892211